MTPGTEPAADPGRLLRLREVENDAGLSSSAIYRQMDAGTFPRPVRLSPGCVRWRQADITAWKLQLQTTGAPVPAAAQATPRAASRAQRTPRPR